MSRSIVPATATMLQSMPPFIWSVTINGMVKIGALTPFEGAAVLEKASALAKTSEPAVGTRAPSARKAAVEAKKAAAKTLNAGAARLAALVTPPAAAAKNQGSRGAKTVLRAAKRSRSTGATRKIGPPMKRSRSKKKQQQFERAQHKARTGQRGKRRAWAGEDQDA